MVSRLIGSSSYTQVDNPLFFPDNGNGLHTDGVRLVINLLFISHLLKDSDLGRLRHMNRSWNFLILSNPKLVNKMLVSSLLFAAKQTAQKIEDRGNRDHLLFKIFKIEIQHDFTMAQERVKSWDVSFKTDALLEIAKVDHRHNFTPAKNHVSTAYYVIPCLHDRDLSKIVELEAKYNLINAKLTVQTMRDPKGSEKARALLKIIQVEVRSNLGDAKATAHALLETKYHGTIYAEAMTEIVKIEAQSNLEAAEATAQSIPARDRLKANREILKKKAQVNFDNALKIAQKSSNPHDNLIEVIKGGAQVNLAAAKAAALTFSNRYTKDQALCEIVEIEVNINLEAAKVTALAIQDPKTKERAVIAIAKKEVKVNFEVFKSSSYAISNHLVRQDLGIQMFKAEALSDLSSANAKTLSIQNSRMKATVILKIAKVVLRNQSQNFFPKKANE
jgi:hypothetical protein